MVVGGGPLGQAGAPVELVKRVYLALVCMDCFEMSVKLFEMSVKLYSRKSICSLKINAPTSPKARTSHLTSTSTPLLSKSEISSF